MDGVSGRRPAKNTTPKYELPWIVKGGMNSQTKYQTVEKQCTFKELLTLCIYTVVENRCIKETDSSLINSSHRKYKEK